MGNGIRGIYLSGERGSEELFLYASLASEISSDDVVYLTSVVNKSESCFSWERLINLGMELDVLPFIYNAITKSGLHKEVPSTEFELLEKEYYSNLSRNMVFLKACNELALSFRESGINVILLGGTGMLGTIYKDIGLRYIGDIDILIHEKSFDKTKEMLLCSGFSQFERYSGVLKKERLTVDIHTDLVGSERINARRLVYKMSDQFCWEDCHPHPEVNGAYILPPVKQLIASAFHCFKHSYSRLIWSIDTAEILKRYGNEKFLRNLPHLCSANRLSLPVYYSLSYINVKGLSAVQDDLLDSLKGAFRESGLGRRIFSMAVNGGDRQGGFSELLSLQAADNYLTRFKFLFESLFPGRKTMMEMYPAFPSKLIILAYLVRFFHMSAIAFKMLVMLFKKELRDRV